MKRCLSLLAAIALTASMTALTSAAEPRWSTLDQVIADLDISASGRAKFEAVAKSAVADRLEMTVTLQMDDGSGWDDVKSWSAENDRRVIKSGSCYVADGANYQLVVEVDVYVDGRYVETGEKTFFYGWY